MTLRDLINHLQHFTRHWPEPLRYPAQAAVAAHDADGGFERLLRSALEVKWAVGDISLPREMGFSDGRWGAVIPRHELDLIIRTNSGRLVVEAKAWQHEVDKEAVIVFLAKVLDFLAAPRFEPSGESIHLGFIGRAGFSQVATRLIFAFGIIPFSAQPDHLSFHHLDSHLVRAVHDSRARGSVAVQHDLEAHRVALAPFIAQEGRDITTLFRCESDSAIVDLQAIRRASAIFEESRAVHRQALEAYRAFRRESLDCRA